MACGRFQLLRFDALAFQLLAQHRAMEGELLFVVFLLVTPAQQGCEPEAEGAERMAHAVAPYVACITKATAAESLAQRVDSDCRRLRPSAVS